MDRFYEGLVEIKKPQNNAIHTDGQGRAVSNFYQDLCLIAFYKGPITLPTGDGERLYSCNLSYQK